MSIELIDKVKPKNGGNFALVDASDVELPDGTRMDKKLEKMMENGFVAQAEPPEDTRLLWVDTNDDSRLKFYNHETDSWEYADNTSLSYPISNTGTELNPEQYYAFGQVDSLSVTLVPAEDGKAHEYCFEFIPSENFAGLTITPEPRWAGEPQIVAGKTCQVSILRGIGVSVSA